MKSALNLNLITKQIPNRIWIKFWIKSESNPNQIWIKWNPNWIWIESDLNSKPNCQLSFNSNSKSNSESNWITNQILHRNLNWIQELYPIRIQIEFQVNFQIKFWIESNQIRFGIWLVIRFRFDSDSFRNSIRIWFWIQFGIYGL